MKLSPEQVRRYFEDGFLVLPDFFSAEEMERAAAEIQASLADPAVFSAHKANFSFAKNPSDGKYYVLQALHTEKLSGFIDQAIRSEGLKDMVTRVIGPDVDLFQAKLVFKKAHGGAEVPWHQDFYYWNRFSSRPLQLNVGIYLDDATRANGCLEVVPRSHHRGLLDHANRKRLLNFPVQRDAPGAGEEVRFLEGRKGTVILFSALTLHHSGANESPNRRMFLNLVFTPAGNDAIPMLPVCRHEGPGASAEIDPARIIAIGGPGPHGGQCGPHYRLKELWKQAVTERDPALTDWVYLHTNQASGNAPEWFSARKQPDVTFVHAQNTATRYPEREGVRFLYGDLMANLEAGRLRQPLSGRLGILAVQTRDYYTVRRLLEHFDGDIKPGSLLIFESLLEGAGWDRGGARALVEFAREKSLELLLLSRTETGLLVKVDARGARFAVAYGTAPWKTNIQGIRSGLGETVGLSKPSGHPLKRLKELLRPIREDHFPSPHLRDFFPRARVPHFKGGDLPGNCCGTHIRRKELWKYALSFVEDKTLAWCEFGVGEGESLDWFAMNKPKENLLFGFDSFEGIPEAWASAPKGQWKTTRYAPNRDDVRIVAGLYDETLAKPENLAALGGRVGFLHIDCDLYGSTRTVFNGLKDRLGPGTVIVFDEYYGYRDWQLHEAKAFLELAMEKKLAIEYLGRSDGQVAVRIAAEGGRMECSVREIRWPGSDNDVRFEVDSRLFLGYSLRAAREYLAVLAKRLKQRRIRVG